jgi:acetyl-CoA acetyltransferase
VTACVVGIGATEFSTNSGRSELSLAVEAVTRALADAGVPGGGVDGMVTFAHDGSPEIEIARTIGAAPLTFTARTQYGGGDSAGAVRLAALAVESGAAQVAVVYRAFNERSGERFGQGYGHLPPAPTADAAQFGYSLPFGLVNAAGWLGLFAARYLHEYGATSADLGRVTVAVRRNAATNPAARFFGRPITLADHQASRWIVEPLRLLDCCLETDGGVALVVTSAERAADCRHRPVVIEAAAQGAAARQYLMSGYYGDDPLAFPELTVVADQLWRQSGLTPGDISVGILYDHFTIAVLAELEAYGFCGRGEAKDYVADGHIELGGRLSVNPHGGQLGEAYLHGMNGIAEAVRQLRGSAVNQVADVAHVLVAAPPGGPSSGLILGVA